MRGDRLFVDGAAIGTGTFGGKLSAAVAAEVAPVGGMEVKADGKDEIGDEEKITHIPEGGDAEDDVIDGTDGGKPTEIQQAIAQRKTTIEVKQHGNTHDDDSPHGSDKQPKHGRQGKGIERGMIIEMAPGLRAKHLDGGIERG